MSTNFQIPAGMDIYRGVMAMIERANTYGAEVRAEFNGIALTAKPGDRPDAVARPFEDHQRRLAQESAARERLVAHKLACFEDLLTACENYVYGRKDDRECEAEMRAAVKKARNG